MLPEGWQRARLAALVSSVNAGVSVNGEDRPAGSREFGVLKISAVTSGAFDPGQNKLIRDLELTRAATRPKADRVMVSRCNTESLVGASAYIEGDHENLFLPDKLWQLEPRTSEHPYMRWLSYWLACPATRTHLSKLATGTSGSMKNITKEQLLSLEVLVPPLTEQRRIARILSTWDQSITVTDRLLVNRQSQWRALLAAALHLPPANPDVVTAGDNSGFPPSVQAGIPTLPATPEGWQRIPLGRHLVEVRRPVALAPDEEYELVTVKRSRGGVCLREVLLGGEVKTPTQFYVRTGDFLISKRQIVHGACGLVPAARDGAVVSNEYAVLNTDGAIDLRFLRYLSETRYFQQTCFHSSIGVHVEKMIFKTERWLKWPFNIPPVDVQRRIVEVLDVACREVELIAAQVSLLKREKAALSSQLLTGKRRVRLFEHEAGAAA